MDALNVVFLHDPDPGPSHSRCIISVKYCSQGIPKASFYKGDVSSCVLVEQKLTSVKFRRFTLNVVINDQRNESQRNSNLTRSIVAAKNEGLSKEGGQMVSTLSTDLEFVKKFTRPNFRVKEFYTLKTRQSRLFSPVINSKNASLSVIWPSFGSN